MKLKEKKRSGMPIALDTIIAHPPTNPNMRKVKGPSNLALAIFSADSLIAETPATATLAAVLGSTKGFVSSADMASSVSGRGDKSTSYQALGLRFAKVSSRKDYDCSL